MSRCFLCGDVVYLNHACPQLEAHRKGSTKTLAELKPLIEAARAYDDLLTAMEKEHKRPDLYFTGYASLTTLRLEIRKIKP